MNAAGRPAHFDNATACIDWLISAVGKTFCVGAPLGLGKPATLLNALYQRAAADPTIELTIITALSLDAPEPGGDLEARLMRPIIERVFADYPGLDYLDAVRTNSLPANITVSEFFFQPGAMLGNAYAQQHYRSVNYTHAARDLIDAGVNVLLQMVAPGTADDELSLSCNTDVTLDLLPWVEDARADGRAPLVVGHVNRQLPTMTRSALVPATSFDALFAGSAADFKPFGPPAQPVSAVDYAIAARVTGLVADGGTLQIGIGSLSDAIAWCCGKRHNENTVFRDLHVALAPNAVETRLVAANDGLAPFATGLYGCTEMLVDAYLHLYRDGVIRRAVYDDTRLQQLVNDGRITARVDIATLDALCEAGTIAPQLGAADVVYLKRIGVFHARVGWQRGMLVVDEPSEPICPDLSDPEARSAIAAYCLGTRLAGATLVHGGFFLGPSAFYARLRALADNERDLFHMTSVGWINHLYGDEPLKRAQRQYARFVNTAIKVSLDGAVAADGLADGRVLSGVGGQYNFVAQAHELAGARSIICVRAVRSGPRGAESGIVAHYGYNTIPRHLRDIVVTEYGVADLRGATDAEIAAALIEIADARFQDTLRAEAVAAGKLSARYRIPAAARANRPDQIQRVFAAGDRADAFPRYPYGSDFTAIEDTLITALKPLSTGALAGVAVDVLRAVPWHVRACQAAAPYLARLGLAEPDGWQERFQQRLVVAALWRAGVLDGH